MTKKHDIVIVGAGLFGSVAAKVAHNQGHRVTIIDDARPYRASPAAGCVIAPGWLTAIDKMDVAYGMAMLDELYGLEELEFKLSAKGLKLPGSMKAHRVRLNSILALPEEIRRVRGTVTAVASGLVTVQGGELAPGTHMYTGKVLVAAGIWCRELLGQVPPVQGLYGCSLLVPGQLAQPRLDRYLPYKQSVAFNMDAKTVWFGDGQSVVADTWVREADIRTVASVERFHQLTGLPTTVRAIKLKIGARPYVKGHMGYFKGVMKDVWVSTGGAKNGTLLAALQADAFLKELT